MFAWRLLDGDQPGFRHCHWSALAFTTRVQGVHRKNKSIVPRQKCDILLIFFLFTRFLRQRSSAELFSQRLLFLDVPPCEHCQPPLPTLTLLVWLYPLGSLFAGSAHHQVYNSKIIFKTLIYYYCNIMILRRLFNAMQTKYIKLGLSFYWPLVFRNHFLKYFFYMLPQGS